MDSAGRTEVSPHERGQMHRHTEIFLSAATLIGVVAGLLSPTPAGSTGWAFKSLVGFATAGAAFSVALLFRLFRMDPSQTKAHVSGLGGDRTLMDLIVFIGSAGALATVAMMLLGGHPKTSTGSFAEGLLTVLTVAAAWLAVHTAYTMRYARHYYNVQPGCISFNTEQPPQFSDFAYLAFDLGMTYQVSDTNTHTKELRKIIFFHTLLSYVFGTCIVASAINFVVGLTS